jgi:hypothetical protein
VTEVCHDPSQDWDVVQDHHVAVVNEGEADSFEPFLHMIVGYCWAATESLTYGYLKRETRDSKEEEGDEIWYLLNTTNQYDISTIPSLSYMPFLYLRTTGAQSYCTLGMASENISKWDVIPDDSAVRSRIEGCFLAQRNHPSQQE